MLLLGFIDSWSYLTPINQYPKHTNLVVQQGLVMVNKKIWYIFVIKP